MEQERQFTVLLVEKAQDVSRMLAFSLESRWGASVYEASDQQSAREFIEHLQGLGLVVIGNPNDNPELCQFVTSDECPPELQFVLAVDHKIKDPSLLTHARMLGVVSRSQYVEELNKILKEKLFPGEVQENLKLSDFVRIRSNLLVLSYPLDADVFIRLSDDKFLRLFSRNDPIEISDIEKYAERGVEFFYVKRSESNRFLKAFQEQIGNVVREASVNEVVVRLLSKEIQESVHWMVSHVGVSEEVREMTRTNVQLVIKMVGKSPKLSSVFDRISREMDQYIVTHSLALAEISCVMASNIDWLSDFTFQKLVLASLFHDITLKNHELARARTLADVQKNSKLLLLESFEDFRSHPIKAAELLRELKNLPPDIDTIIRQHHELADGSGFPNGLNANQLTPLTCVFIVAHDFVDYMLSRPPSPSLIDFLDQNRNLYGSGYFKKIAKTLEEKLGKE